MITLAKRREDGAHIYPSKILAIEGRVEREGGRKVKTKTKKQKHEGKPSCRASTAVSLRASSYMRHPSRRCTHTHTQMYMEPNISRSLVSSRKRFSFPVCVVSSSYSFSLCFPASDRERVCVCGREEEEEEEGRETKR